jgi:regulator of sigma E protease
MDSPFELLRVLQVVFGIGLVIFVHELGHYLAARWCGVRVETFSLGFGPRLLGKRIGQTDYQVALVPLGGFCRMAGEERRFEGLPPEPDELPAKSVGQRFFIYSGGVLMNLLFGLVVFPILFQVGVPFTTPTIGQAIPGGAAWRARVPDGAQVLAVNDARVVDFQHLFTEVALGDPQRTTITVLDPATGAERTYELTPQRNESEGLTTIGVRPGFERAPDGGILLEVDEDTPAWRAGLRDGDRLLRVLNGAPGQWPMDQLDLLAGMSRPWELEVAAEEGSRTVRLEPEMSGESEPPRVGIAVRIDRIAALRPGPLLDAIGLEVGDRVLRSGERVVLESGDFARGLLAAGGATTLLVRRDERELTLAVPALDEDRIMALVSDVVVAADEDSTEIVVQANGPAERAGVRTLDRILRVDGTETGSWNDIVKLIRLAGREERSVEFRIARDGSREHLTVTVTPEAAPRPIYGLALRQAEYVYRSKNLGEAIVFGAQCSWRFLEDSWLTLERMLKRDVSPKNVGGIITISAVSYSLTEDGWVKLFFFLCLVSINLAFLNVLPIPVLDGGHLFFLIVEKIKGSPVSDRVLSASQAVGVVLLLSLMIYVTYNDLVRWVFPAQ